MTLYRKYRPQRFQDLVGQDRIATILQQSLLRGQAGHAYLFTGPRGTGKTSTARIFAKAVVCQQPQKTKSRYEPCNACPSCLAVTDQHTTDLIEIDAASNRGIDDIRTLRDQAAYPPSQLSHKIYIIDEVHALTTDAFNALLKTLEEPPSHCIFVLATTELHKVPITIRSRCQLLRFDSGSIAHVAKKLKSIVEQEGIAIEDAALSLIAAHAEGGYRDAESLLDQMQLHEGTLTVEKVEHALGVLPHATATQLVDACLHGETETVKSLLAEINSLPGSSERIIHQMITEIRERIYNDSSGTPSSSSRALVYALEQLIEAYIFQKTTPWPKLPLEIACLNIAEKARPSSAPSAPVSPAPQTAAQKPAPAPTVAAVRTQAPETIEKPVTVAPAKDLHIEAKAPVIELRDQPAPTPYNGDIRKAWRTMIDKMSRENPIIAQTLKNAVFHTADGSTIHIHVHFKFHATKLSERKIKQRALELLSEITGIDWDIAYEVNGNLPKHQPAKELTADASAVFETNPT